MKISEWKIEGKSYQIGDTGDYDGHYELSIGNYILHSNTEVDDDGWDKLNRIVKELNELKMYWWDPYEGADQHIIGHLQEEAGAVQQFLREKGLTEEYEKWYISPRPFNEIKIGEL